MTPAELKARREALGLPARWLADRWGVSTTSVQRWECDRHLPPELEADLESIELMADDLACGLADSGGDVAVPMTDGDSPDGMPAAFHRAVALRAVSRSGGRIVYTDRR